MSISSEISRISGNVSDALSAISNKGVTVPQGANSDDLSDLIMQISSGGTPVTYALSMSGNVITLTGSDGSTSSVTLPIYNGEIWTGGSY